MSKHRGILASGAYVPRRRLQRQTVYEANSWFAPGLKGLARGEKAIANWDEDSITMAVEAARDCLGTRDRGVIDGLSLASTSLPFADRLNVGVVKEALNLSDAVRASDLTGSQRAGTSALMQGLDGSATMLCLASERRKARPASEGELMQGDAAAAILVGEGEVIARLLGAYSSTVDFVDHFRASGQDFDYGWESRWIRDEGFNRLLADTLKQALVSFGVEGSVIDRALIALPTQGVPQALAKKCGIDAASVADPLIGNLGDAGVALPLLMLAAALEQAAPGEKILLVGFGQGADVLLFETTDAIASNERGRGVAGHLAAGLADENYPRFLFHRGLLDMERGMRAEMDQKQPGTTLSRNRKTVLGLVGGRDPASGAVQFPKSEIAVESAAGPRGALEDYPLAERTARILSYTADSLAYSPDPPSYYGLVDFEGGGRMMCEFADASAEDIEVGREMRMSFRIKAIDEMRHFTRYFWKATPVRDGGK